MPRIKMSQDFGVNQGLVEELYLKYRENPAAVPESWNQAVEHDRTQVRANHVRGDRHRYGRWRRSKRAGAEKRRADYKGRKRCLGGLAM